MVFVFELVDSNISVSSFTSVIDVNGTTGVSIFFSIIFFSSIKLRLFSIIFDSFSSFLAISCDSPKNTASFMIAEMQRWILKSMPTLFKLISYQDTGVHLGTIYKASNWVSNGESKFVSWEKHSKRPGKIEQSLS